MKNLYLFLIVFLAGGLLRAQTATQYTFARASIAPVSIVGDAGTTATTAISDDDLTLTGIPIGFDFVFCGVTYNTLSACSNGWLSLANSDVDDYSNTVANIPGPGFLMTFWDDLNGGQGSATAYYKVSGTAPTRVFTFQWGTTGGGRWGNITGSGRAIFIARLYESSNVIQYSYATGNFSGNSGTIGIANSTTDFLTLADETSTAAGTTFSTSVANSPANNTQLSWTPPPAISVSPTSLSFTAGVSAPSTSLNIVVRAYGLTSGLVAVNAPAGFEVFNGSAWVTSMNVSAIAAAAGTYVNATVPVRYAGSPSTGTFTGNLTCTSAGATTANVALTANVTAPCSGTPTPGTVAASATTGSCTPYISNLSLSGATVAAGITYQWQSSPNAIAWTDVAGATNATYAATVSDVIYYRCRVSCGASPATTAEVMLNYNSCILLPASGTVSVTTCNGAFYDNGGPSGNYNDDQTSTIRIFPTAVGSKVKVSFSFFDVEEGYDRLRIYNGSTVNGANLIADYDGTTLPPDITSTAADGALSFRLVSDGSLNYGGFAATISNVQPDPFTTQPPASTVVCGLGLPASISFTPIAGSFTYKWYNNGTTNSNTGGTLIAGETGTSYAPSTAVAGTTYYYAVVTNDCGTTVASNPAAVLVGPAPAAITGPSEVCTGVIIDLDNTTAGGTWSSSATAMGTVDPSSGVVTGITAGTTNISYTMPSTCSVTKTITVNTTPSAITGGAPVCVAATITLNSTPSGGTWQSDNIANATVDASLGEVTGVAPGTAGITYSLPTGCFAAYAATVNTTPGPIDGSSVVCIDDGIFLDNTITGGSWSSSAPAIASTPDPTIGVVLGLSSGTADITYELPSGCRAVKTVTVSALPSAITGTTTICPTATTTLSSSPVGGTWTSSNTTTATVDISSGVVTGNAGGTTTISYTAPTTCAISTVVSVHAVPAAITGTPAVCLGDATQLSHAVSSGTWMSSNTSVASVDATGLVSGIDAGTSTIVYTLPVGCTTSVEVTVNALPPAITGIAEVCKNAVTDLDISDAGGTWTSDNTSIATVDGNGLVTGQTDGNALITYIDGNNCRSTKQVTVHPLPDAITGDLEICNGLTTTLSTIATGGSWGSQNTTVATIDAAGLVTGINAGTSTISYTYTGTGCYTTDILTVDPLPSASTGTFTVCVASTTLLANTGSGTWLSDATGIAQVDVNSGLVSGVSAGTANITYTLPTGCITSSVVSVIALPDAITGTAAVCEGAQTTLSSTSAGGTWSSADGSIATVPDASVGTINGIAEGNTNIVYTLPSGCSVTKQATVNPLPDAIAGPSEICLDAAAVLTNGFGGGDWISSDAGIVSVDGLGNISGVATGSATITYLLPTGCQTTHTVSVNPPPDAITGTFAVCVNSTTDLDNATPDGVWSTGDAAIAGIDVATGLVSGVSEGTVNIIYTLPTTCAASVTVTVNRLPALITGTLAVCHMSTTDLDNTDAGTWSSSNTAVAGIDADGIVTGNSPGIADITVTIGTGCARTAEVTVNPLPDAITGDMKVCEGLTSQLTGTGIGGWGVDAPGTNISITGTGLVTAIAAGTSTVTYTLPTGCYTTSVFTVDPLPAAVTGMAPVCEQETITLSNTATGGTWSSSDAAIAAVDAASGDLSGVAEGNATITYTSADGCIVTIEATVNPLPDVITGNTEVCAGLITDLDNATTGGAWNGDADAIATVDAITGEVTGVAEGTVGITYTLGTGCRVSDIVTVHPLPDAIVGNSDVCIGLATTLTNATMGGSWQSSDAGIADIGTSTGAVTGITDGSVTITYTLSTGCIMTMPFTVNPLPAAITGTLSSCMGVTGTLDDPGTGGTWSSGTTAIADVDAAGVVTTFTDGNAAITYTLPTGCITTAEYTVNPLPAAFSGAVQVCEGVTGALANTLTGGTWLSSDAAIADVVEASGTITGIAAGTADVTYTLPTGCSRTETVTVNAAVPAIDGPGEICEGLTLTLSNTEPDGTWSSNDVAIATVGATDGVVTGAGAGVVSVVYTLATGCFATTEVTVNALPDVITGSMQVCAGLTTTLASTTADGTWSGGATGIGSIDAAGIVTGIGAGNVPVTYTHTATGCLRTADVVVNALPAAQSVTGGGSYCSGGAGVAIGVSNSVSGVNYELMMGSTPVLTLVGTGTPLNYGTYSVAGTYTVQATNATTGCTKPMTGSAIVTITSLVTPSVTMTLSTSDTVCDGTATTFTAVPVNGGTTPGYQWQVNGAVVSAASSYTYSSADGDVVRLRLLSSEACPSPDTAIAANTMNVIANQLPTINITKLTSDTICQFDIAAFSAAATWTGIAPVYTWLRNGSSVIGTGTSLSYAPADGDIITCKLTSNYRCRLADNVTSAGITLNVDSVYVPLIDISAAPGLTVAPGRVVTLTATVASAGPAPVFEWRRNGVVIPGQTTSVLAMVFNNGDEVTCMVYGSGTCGLPSFNIVRITVDPSVGIDGISSTIGDIRLTPNPNNGHFTISGSVTGVEGSVMVDITDMLGQSVYHSAIPVRDGGINGSVTLSNTLANGMYMISISNGTERRVFNFVLKQ